MLDKNALMQMLESIRDERGAKANTARRIGNAFLSLLDYATTTADGKLSSVHDDVAQGVITFIKGLVATGLAKLDSVQSGNLDKEKELGYSIEKEENGKYHGYINDLTVWSNGVFKNLEVTGLAHFFELVIDKIKSAGGAALFTPADGFDIDLVEEIDGGYRLLWRCQDGDGNQRDNMWRKDDQALCMSFNQAKVGEAHNVANKYYWALVTAVSDSAAPIEKDGEYYNYIEISSSDCDGTVNPEKGDSIVMLGYRGTDDKARQSAIYLSAYSSIDKGLTAPLFAQYRGINDFDLASHRTTYHDANGSKVVGQFEFESGESLDDYIKDNAATTAVYQIEVYGMFRVDRDGNFTGTNYFQDKKDTRAVGVALYRTKGNTKEFVGDGDYYFWVDPDSVYLIQSPQGHSSNQIYLYQSQLATAPSYITVKIYDLIMDEKTHAPMPGSQLYASVTIPILRDGEDGKDGADGVDGADGADGSDGKDATSYVLSFVASKTYVSSTQTTVVNVKVTRSVGAAITTAYPDVLGLTCKASTDGTEASGLEYMINTYGYFDLSAYPGVEVFRVDVYKDKTLVATGSYSPSSKGEDGKNGENGKGALEILVNPQTVVFDTNDNGIVPTSTSKTAKISCYRDGVKITNVSCGFHDTLNCSGNVQDNGDGTSTVTISNISQEAIDSSTKVSVTSGYVEVSVWDKETGLNHYIQVPFQVNVSKYTGKMLADNKTFQTQYTEISNNYKNLPLKTDDELTKYTSSIKQTAREISLKVSEQAVGRRNMLYGSAFRKKDECPRIQLYGDFLGNTYTKYYYGDQGVYMNGGVGETNCLKVKCYYDGSNLQYPGFFYNCTSYDGLGNIKIEKGKKYTISVYVKGDTVGSDVCIETTYKTAKNSVNTEQVSNANVIKGNRYCYFTSDNVGKWVLHQITIDTSNAGDNEYLAVQIWLSHTKTNVIATAYFCRPMMEEGEEYCGWTMAEEDYDYVGGNLLDSSKDLDVSGNLFWREKVVENGFAEKINAAKITVTGSYEEIVQWKYVMEANTDYLFSFWAKSDYPSDCYLMAYAYRPSDNNARTFYEGSQGQFGYSPSGGDGGTKFLLSKGWKRYWVHWRTGSEKVPERVLLRNIPISSASTAEKTIWIAEPKLEKGCTVTDWTEKRTDMVDKQALLAAGVDITNKKITATADNFVVQNNSGGTTMMVDSDGQLNTNLVRAKALTTLGSDGRSVNIEDGLISVFGTQGVANIRFGVDSDGRSILSYYDNDGTWKYDLGPNGYDASKMKGSTFEELQLVEQYNVVYTNDVFYSIWRTTINDKTYEFYRVGRSYDSYIFGNRTRADGLYPSNDPTKNKSVKKLYRYSAGKLNGNYVLDPSKGLSTLALVQAADGKVFTSNGTLAKDGSLVNLATGNYFKYGVKTSLGLNPFFEEDFDWPAARYTGYIQIVNGVVKNFDLNSYGTVTVNGGKLQ